MSTPPRPMTSDELAQLSAYLPDDLTPDQLEDVLRAAHHVAAQAHSAGHSAGRQVTAMRHRAEADQRRREEATTLDQKVEADERTQAWEALAQHPIFADAHNMDGVLVENMLAALDKAQAPCTHLHVGTPTNPAPWGTQ